MKMYAVTVKLPKNKAHDPRNKVTGPCPVNGKTCTDVTGEHHTMVVAALNGEHAKSMVPPEFTHITRVEQVS